MAVLSAGGGHGVDGGDGFKQSRFDCHYRSLHSFLSIEIKCIIF